MCMRRSLVSLIMFPGCGLSLCEPYEPCDPRLVDSVSHFLVVSVIPTAPTILPHSLLQDSLSYASCLAVGSQRGSKEPRKPGLVILDRPSHFHQHLCPSSVCKIGACIKHLKYLLVVSRFYIDRHSVSHLQNIMGWDTRLWGPCVCRLSPEHPDGCIRIVGKP